MRDGKGNKLLEMTVKGVNRLDPLGGKSDKGESSNSEVDGKRGREKLNR